jgi:hypothetical protein
VLGYLDELLLVPLGIVVALRLIPSEVRVEARARAADELRAGRPVSWAGAVLMAATWVALAAVGLW